MAVLTAAKRGRTSSYSSLSLGSSPGENSLMPTPFSSRTLLSAVAMFFFPLLRQLARQLHRAADGHLVDLHVGGHEDDSLDQARALLEPGTSKGIRGRAARKQSERQREDQQESRPP